MARPGRADLVTPTQELLLEVLAARTRLGETLWTFDARFAGQLRQLEAEGLVEVMSGTIEKTVRASLTSKGQDAMLSSVYWPPMFDDVRCWPIEAQARAIGGTLETQFTGDERYGRVVGPWTAY